MSGLFVRLNEAGGTVAVGVGERARVAVGDGLAVRVGLGKGVLVAGAGVDVIVAGGVTCSSSLSPG